MIPLNFLQHLNITYMYHNYVHLMYILYKHKVRQTATNPEETDKDKVPNGTRRQNHLQT